MKDGCLTIIFSTIIIAACVGLAAIADSTECHETGKALNYQTEWHYWAGCVVTKPDGSKVLLKQMRDMDK